MSRELPRGWTLSTIGELVKFNPKNKVEDHVDAGFIPMSQVPTEYGEPVKVEQKKWGDIKKGYSHFQNDDVILAKITPCFENGKAAIIEGLPNGIGSGSTEYFVLRAVDNLYYPKLLLAFVKQLGFLKNGAAVMTGSVGHRRVPKNYVLEHPIPVPPFPEQKRIVDKLDCLLAKVDTCKARLDKVPEIIKRFRQSVLADATSGRLTEDWRLENPSRRFCTKHIQKLSIDRTAMYLAECQNAKKAGKKKPRKYTNLDTKIALNQNALAYFPCIPDQWEKAPLSFITANKTDSIVDGPFGASIKVDVDYIEEGVPVIRMINIRPFKFVKDNRKFIKPEKFSQLYRHNIQSGDVLLAKVGATIGDCCLYPESEEIAMLSTTGSCRITVDSGIYDGSFLEVVINSYRNMLVALSSTTAQPFLNMKTIKGIPVPIPSLVEQKEIVKRVGALFSIADQLEEKLKRAQAGVEKLTASILAKAFRGELVPQDLNDEPAEKLLKRIRCYSIDN